MRSFTFLIAGILWLTPLTATAKTVKKASTDQTVIVQLEKKNHSITISTSPKGPLYTVRDSKGKVIADALTETQLQAKLPEIYREVKKAIADGKLDASLDHGHIGPSAGAPSAMPGNQ